MKMANKNHVILPLVVLLSTVIFTVDTALGFPDIKSIVGGLLEPLTKTLTYVKSTVDAVKETTLSIYNNTQKLSQEVSNLPILIKQSLAPLKSVPSLMTSMSNNINDIPEKILGISSSLIKIPSTLGDIIRNTTNSILSKVDVIPITLIDNVKNLLKPIEELIKNLISPDKFINLITEITNDKHEDIIRYITSTTLEIVSVIAQTIWNRYNTIICICLGVGFILVFIPISIICILMCSISSKLSKLSKVTKINDDDDDEDHDVNSSITLKT
ncbi:hypothetical protein [Trichoplusia ni ascovirus 2c]|uniref:hypothetical protein n=1 Tax=Trichoplusia ni ascovirus 2c TaxID=328615 RepID=UPI0000E4426F|nr:hypothetical protein TNAV2c_gp155 [Trichoplusia ni ascovirus 2c]ABF70670.1 hypothetical protein [Trichoplusia ni ascovirus 2c]